jgi:hypothetical protein
MAAIEATGTKACYLFRLLLRWPGRELLRVSYERAWEGSMLADRSVVTVFPALARKEDSYVASSISKLHEVVRIDYPMGYCYVVHNRNVNDLEHFEGVFSKSSAIDGCSSYSEAVALVGESLPLLDR